MTVPESPGSALAPGCAGGAASAADAGVLQNEKQQVTTGPVVVRESLSYWVVYKPAFWSCLEDGTATSAGISRTSVVGYLQEHFSLGQAPAIYIAELNHGFLYPLETDWSGFLIVAKTVNGYAALNEQLIAGKLTGHFEVILRAEERDVLQIKTVPLLQLEPGSPEVVVVDVVIRDVFDASYETGGRPKSPDRARSAWCRPALQDYHKGDTARSYDCCPFLTHASITCQFQLRPEPGFLSRSFGSARQSGQDPPGSSGFLGPWRWCNRAFCHGTSITFHDIDAGVGSLEETMKGAQRADGGTDFDSLPISTFECALPTDLDGILRQLRQSGSLQSAKWDSGHSKHSSGSSGGMAIMPRGPSATSLRPSLLLGALLATSTGFILCRCWLGRRMGWNGLRFGRSGGSWNGLGVGASSLLAVRDALLISWLFLETTVTNRFEDLQIFFSRALFGACPSNSIYPPPG
ncbi:hypothetical protein CSUI_000851 [Cystoisospora suis]|uniref:Uncharacterized protein n=1 Tax=Cystoisospora suis TaxID=483139 RepID=A0A2C6LCG3_9APIC|nr:hypothetical protein CSUI_000851 [Cystoisospora suis]